MILFPNLKKIKSYITIFLYKTVVDTTVLYTIFFQNKDLKSKKKKITVYLSINQKDFYLSIMSMSSILFFLPEVEFKIINDGTLSKIQIWLYKKSFLPISFVTTEIEQQIERKIRDYPELLNFYSYGWSGKKFIIPLLDLEYNKIIQLDADVLFFHPPAEIIKWIDEKNNYNYFLKDYRNFSVISSIELSSIINKKPKIAKVNSGLLCINLKEFWKNNSLSEINRFIKDIKKIVLDRMVYDYNEPNEMKYIFPLIEQTLHWMTLNNCLTYALNNKYNVFPIHKFLHKRISDSTFIHFTGEVVYNRSLYKYLFFSMINKFIDSLLRRGDLSKPWYIYSNNYCWNCQHR